MEDSDVLTVNSFCYTCKVDQINSLLEAVLPPEDMGVHLFGDGVHFVSSSDRGEVGWPAHGGGVNVG